MMRWLLVAMTICGPAFGQTSVPLTQFQAAVTAAVRTNLAVGAPNGLVPLDSQGGIAVAGALSAGGATAGAAAGLYSALYPGITFTDTGSVFFTFPSTGTEIQRSGLAAYFRNQKAASGIAGNAVGVFSSGTCEAAGSACWGWNSLLQDAATRAVGSATGKILIGGELDFNVMNPATQVIGVSVGGNSLAQPANANGFIVNTLGNGNRWTGGFITIDGAAQYALSVGANAATGNNVPSQYAAFAYRDANGGRQTATLQVVSAGGGSAGFLSLTSSGGVDVALNGRTLYAGGVNVGGSTFTGSIYLTGLPTCASSPPGGSMCRDTTTTPATLKVM